MHMPAGDRCASLPLLRCWSAAAQEAAPQQPSSPSLSKQAQQQAQQIQQKRSAGSQPGRPPPSAHGDAQPVPTCPPAPSSPHHWTLFPRAFLGTTCTLTAPADSPTGTHSPEAPLHSCWEVQANQAQHAQRAQQEPTQRPGEGGDTEQRPAAGLALEQKQAVQLARDLAAVGMGAVGEDGRRQGPRSSQVRGAIVRHGSKI